MWSVCVVFFNRLSEFKSHGSDAVSQEVSFVIEFFLKGSVSALDAAVICWPAGRQDDEWNVYIFTGLFKFCHEFRAAIHLYGFYGKGCFINQFPQEPLGRRRFGV